MILSKSLAVIKILSSVLIAAIVIFCSCVSMRKDKGLEKISLIVSYPVIIMNNERHDSINFFNLKDTLWIFYYNKNVLYRLYGTRDLETDKKISGTETWFIFREKAAHGFLFNSINDSSKGLKLPVDSFLNNRAYASANFDTPSDSLFGKIENRGDTIVEKYFAKTSHGDNYPDSLYYYFTNNLENINYSFSRKLDSVKNMKLYKIRLLYNEGFSISYKTMLPKREFLFEIREEAIANSKEVISFIERVKNQIKE